MRVALYARVSTADKSQDPELQLAELRDFALHAGFEIRAEFVDVGVSGSKDSRPQLDAMFSLVKRRQFDAVLVWKLDRYARSLRFLVNSLAEFEALNVKFISLRDNIDLTTPAGKLMFHVIAAMAEFERSLIQERVRAGMRRAKLKGRQIGRKPVSVDRERILQMKSQGLSWRQIQSETGLSSGTLSRRVFSAV